MASLILRRAFRPNPTSKTFLSQTTRKISSTSVKKIKLFRHCPPPSATPTITLFPGEGIGPEITTSVKKVFETAEVPIDWEEFKTAQVLEEYDYEEYVGKEVDPKTKSLLSWEGIKSVRSNGAALKGPMDGPLGIPGCRTFNFAFRNELDIYANVRPFNTLYGYQSPYKDVNLVTIHETPKCVIPEQEEEEDSSDSELEEREEKKPQNDRGEYVFEEDYIMKRSMRVAECAFQYAKAHGRERISALHAPNLVKMVDDIFLECCRNVAKTYSEIKYTEVDTEKCRNMLVIDPADFDVLVMPNYHGFLMNNFIDKYLGGSKLSPSYNIGEGGIALAETKHGVAPDIAGKNVANPTELLLSAVMLLRHLKLNDKADEIHNAIIKTIATGKYRALNLEGITTTTEFTKVICDNL